MKTRSIPYGYKMDRGIILVNEEEANQIRRIFNLRSYGVGIYAIGKMLHEEKISFFADTRDKAIKKVSAILYKPIYAGAKDYPAIIVKETFDKVQKMKSMPLRKNKKEETKREITDYIFAPTDVIKNKKHEIEVFIKDKKTTSEQIRKSIIDLTAELYSCIRPKGETL